MKKHIIIASLVTLSFAFVAAAQVTVSMYPFNNDLMVGSSGSEVARLQSMLIGKGFDIPSISSGNIATGYFGLQTQNALKSYQRSIGVPAYGYFDLSTRQYINRGGNSNNGNGNGNNNNSASFKIVRPNGGESWQKGTTQNITWTSSNSINIRATYVDITLIPYYQPCTGQICAMSATQSGNSASMMNPYRAPYTIASGISVNANSYSWFVGSQYITNSYNSNGLINPSSPPPIPDGQYTVQICQTGTSVCTSSASPFTIYSNGTPVGNQPVISGVDAPTTLTVGQTGTWTVHATDPLNGTLSYSVNWGEPVMAYPTTSGLVMQDSFIQTSSFQHSYAVAGTYTVTFTVRNASGREVKTTSTVRVTGSSQTSWISVISPNGGEVWNIGENRTISWTVNSTGYSGAAYPYNNQYYDVYLVSQGCDYRAACMTVPQSLAKNVQGNSYVWSVGSLMANTGITGTYTIEVCQAGMMSVSVCDSSNAPFTINSSIYSSTPDINVSSPNGGEVWYSGSYQTISFNITGDSGRIGNNVTAYLVNSNNQQTYLGTFSQGIGAGSKSFNLTVPTNISSGQNRLLVNLYSGSTQQAYDYSDSYFTVYSYPTPLPVYGCPEGYICTRKATQL